MNRAELGALRDAIDTILNWAPIPCARPNRELASQTDVSKPKSAPIPVGCSALVLTGPPL